MFAITYFRPKVPTLRYGRGQYWLLWTFNQKMDTSNRILISISPNVEYHYVYDILYSILHFWPKFPRSDMGVVSTDFYEPWILKWVLAINFSGWFNLL